jgi:AAA15 family ATPase/GTPase
MGNTMLSKFEVRNFKNFENTFSFDLSKTKMYEFNNECVIDGIVNKALIYGHNGTGKSNLGFAIFDLISHLTDKHVPKHAYKNYLYAGNSEDIAVFYFEFKFDEDTIIYEYGKSDIETLIYETLTINDKKFAHIDRRKSNIAEISFEGTEGLENDLEDSVISVISYIDKYSIIKNKEEKRIFKSFLKFINGMLFFRSLEKNNYIGLEQGSKGLGNYIIENKLIEDFESFLKKAGIKCKLSVIVDQDEARTLAFDFGNRKVPFHEIASMGTRSLTLFYYWLQRLKENSTVSFVFIDEFDAFYHHSLAKIIVKMLRDINAQTIITTHNTSIMSNDILRPDCYFLMGNKKIKSLSSGTDKDIRSAHNIEKMYKAGAFNE